MAKKLPRNAPPEKHEAESPPDVPPPKRGRRRPVTTRLVKLTPGNRRSLYAASEHLTTEARRAFQLSLPFNVFTQDPWIAQQHPELEKQDDFTVDWEPGLTDGPTSARFAVVDFNSDSGALTAPVTWDDAQQAFLGTSGQPIRQDVADPQFHQVNVWVLLQQALDYFEQGRGLGRPISWAFEGNRLIVVPHAGQGQNAFYDRQSKSLQFYYFDAEDATVYTCLSSDIVNHEFGHAVLDGIRPYYNESVEVQTSGFHEFVGDLSAILLGLRNNTFRRWLADKTKGNLSEADALSSVAKQFGKAIGGMPYLRSAANTETMTDVADEPSPHRVSQVLTGAMFDIMIDLSDRMAANGNSSAPSRFWNLSQRMQCTALQPLDLLPPVDVTFRDYALAVIRAEELANPLDPYNDRKLFINRFRKRGILSAKDQKALRDPHGLYTRRRLLIHHSIDDISRSRAAAYRFLDDNRDELLIPALQDFLVTDLYDARKLRPDGSPLPRQIILEYVWREDVLLEGRRFGHLSGQTTPLYCGGTLVFDQTGALLSWMRKPGTTGRTLRKGKRSTSQLALEWDNEVAAGEARRTGLLKSIASQIASGRIGTSAGNPNGLLATRVPAIVADDSQGQVRFRRSPHLNLAENDHHESEGGRPWEISC